MLNPGSRDTRRWAIYGSWVLVCLGIFWKPLYALYELVTNDESASHILLVPLIAATLLYLERKPLERNGSRDYRIALCFAIPAITCALLASRNGWSDSKHQLSSFILALWLFLIAGFVAILGSKTARNSFFPLAFLAFAIPMPDAILNRVIYWLQAGSAEIASFFFDLSGAPVLREGMVFRLSKVSIIVARECSGIRSSIALLILAVLVAHFSFRPLWKKCAFVAAGLMMMLVKNGIRIATLTLLANYVDVDFLTGKLHHRGGIVFFLIGLLILVPVFWLLQRGERRPREAGTSLETA